MAVIHPNAIAAIARVTIMSDLHLKRAEGDCARLEISRWMMIAAPSIASGGRHE